MREILKALCASLVIALCASSTAIARSGSPRIKGEPISLYRPEQRSSTFDGCKNVFPGEAPILLESIPASWKPRGLCSNNFAVLYSGLSKTPLLVVERLSRESLQGAKYEARANEFFPDPRLPKSERSDLKDFKGSGLDRGHLSAAANQPDWTAMAQSFAMSNMVPQDPTNNRKIWAKLEADTRKYVMRAKGDVFVFSGPLFREGHQTIGRNGVWVPTHLFKLVFDPDAGKSWAHLLPNDSSPYKGPPLKYQEFVKETGWNLLGSIP